MPFSSIRLIAAWALAHFGYRAAIIALPFLALSETGSTWTVGLVTGAAGVPTIAAPWWTPHFQRRLGSARALAALLAAEGVATLIVPATAAAATLTPGVMIASGLAVGTLNALSGPLNSALLAELGDARNPHHGAAQLLAVQETVVRGVMTLAPLATLPLLTMAGAAWTVALEGMLSLAGAGLVASMALQTKGSDDEPRPLVRDLLSRHKEIRLGWTIRGVGCAAWFAFPLGLSMLGVQQGRGALLATVGLTAFAAASVLGGGFGIVAARSRRPAMLNSAAWLVAGLGWIVMGCVPTPIVIAAAAIVMGLSVPAGNAATTAMVTRVTADLERRAALTGQSTVVTGSSTLGTLLGGPLIALAGPRAAILATGVVVALASLTSAWVSRSARVQSSGSSTRKPAPTAPGT